MFGLSFAEAALLGVIGLVVLGPKQLPEVARMIGRLLNELKRASSDLTEVLMDAKDQTQKSLLDARDEYNKVLEKASQLEEPKPKTPPQDPTDV
jgi:sec-independent protein translocase protein TatB